MSAMNWADPDEGGYLYNDELSEVLREQVQALTKFRPLCDADDGEAKGLHRGETFRWNVYSDVGTQGRELSEFQEMPETNFTISVKSLTITEAGNSVPFTGKLQSLAKQKVETIIDKTLRHDARKYFDIKAWAQFEQCDLRASVTTGTTAITLDTDGTATDTNNVAMGTGHVKAIVDTMKERNIPGFVGDDYVCITHPTTLRTFKNQLESLHQYTDGGIGRIMNGEIGKYEGVRFVEQNFIPKGGAEDSVTFDPYTRTADAWNNAQSSWAFYFGADTVMEALAIPEEIRAKIPGDYGRSRGIAWYTLGGFGIVHDDATNCRILKWDSAA